MTPAEFAEIRDAELNGHIDTLKEACDWMNAESEVAGTDGGKLLDYVTSASVVIQALESARRERDEYVGYIQEMDRRIGEWNKLGVQDVPTLVAERDALKAQLAEARRERDVFSYDRLTMERQRAEAERVTARAEAEQFRAERDALAAELSESHEDHKATCEKALAKGFV